jgi:hypothetical protein
MWSVNSVSALLATSALLLNAGVVFAALIRNNHGLIKTGETRA